MIICGTGHRPDKLGGYDEESFERLVNIAWDAIDDIRPTVVISGMALGWDQALAKAAILHGAELHAYCPCEGQDSRWPPSSRKLFEKIISMASKVHYTYKGGYPGPWCMQQRNIEMVDASECVLAMFNGSPGGTANCIEYAEKKNKTVINLWKDLQKVWANH